MGGLGRVAKVRKKCEKCKLWKFFKNPGFIEWGTEVYFYVVGISTFFFEIRLPMDQKEGAALIFIFFI